ncbi:MAG TPA: NFACT family protein, partial [Allocoleopsis sp.]
MQLVDFTTLTALCTQLRTEWIPSRIEQVYQRDRYTINMGLRTLKKRGWLTIAWHPLAARICLGDNPPKIPDTFTFSDQLRHQLNGLALINIAAIAPMERVLDLQFAKRPDDPIIWHLYIEIMGKYSNVILTGADDMIVTVAHQVSSQQSRVRPLQTGQVYELPPSLTSTIPSLNESEERWQERVSLIPGNLAKQLLKNYRGLSPALVNSMLNVAGLNPAQTNDSLTSQQWHNLFLVWQQWLNFISQLQNNDSSSIKPGFTEDGYNVMGWGIIKPVESLQSLVNQYYSQKLNQQEFNQLHHQLKEKIKSVLNKLIIKETAHKSTLQQVEQADIYKEKSDLL